jgi:transcriptional regulator of acetoin/glycerol metabolism
MNELTRVELHLRPSGRYATLREVEDAYIAEVMAWSEGNISKASKTLGINRRTLYRRLRQAGFVRGGDAERLRLTRLPAHPATG